MLRLLSLRNRTGAPPTAATRTVAPVTDPLDDGPTSVWTTLAAVQREWIVAVVGLVLSLAGTTVALKAPGVYFEQARVTFIAPPSPTGNQFSSDQGSLVAVAGLVSRQLDETGGALAFSPTATIVDMGIRDGVWVRLPNYGGQWTPSFQRAELDVQVVGQDPKRVEARFRETIDRIRTTLRDGQLEVGARPANKLIECAVTPESPPIYYQQGSGSRAAAAAFFLGLALTLVVTVLVDRARRRRSSAVRSRGNRSAAREPAEPAQV